MGATKIQVGYGSDGRGSNGKALYGRRRSGKLLHNGGFSGQPTVDYARVEQDDWDRIFGKKVDAKKEES